MPDRLLSAGASKRLVLRGSRINAAFVW